VDGIDSLDPVWYSCCRWFLGLCENYETYTAISYIASVARYDRVLRLRLLAAPVRVIETAFACNNEVRSTNQFVKALEKLSGGSFLSPTLFFVLWIIGLVGLVWLVESGFSPPIFGQAGSWLLEHPFEVLMFVVIVLILFFLFVPRGES